jgi:hypothetical protein
VKEFTKMSVRGYVLLYRSLLGKNYLADTLHDSTNKNKFQLLVPPAAGEEQGK